MTRVLLDTSAYSAFLRGHLEIKRALQETDEIYVNPIVLGELRAGFLGGKHRRQNETELRAFLESPRVRVVDVSEETAGRYAIILDDLRQAGTPIPSNDIWIAATAMEHGLPILALDAHYRHVRQVLLHWFEIS